MDIIASIFAEKKLATFLILTLVIGGGAAYTSGRAMAMTWRPRWQLLLYMLLLGCVIRFFHFSLFEGSLLSGRFYLSDTGVLIACALLGYQVTRAHQLATHYSWLFKKTTPLSWTNK